jgi:hypothetical protein
MFLAERAAMHGIRKGLKAEPEFDPSRKTPNWGKRKLKRDE